MDPLPAAGARPAEGGAVGIEATRLRHINAAAPVALAARAQRARLVGERKPVTAVFADIVGSTALAERIDPEDWVGIINLAFDELSRCVFDYEGTIAQLLGDAIVSFFGAPVAHEDDPERAVRAALAMTEAMRSYGQTLQRTHGIDFRIRVGISTGPVLVGNVGSDLRYDYTAIGDTMNLASRLQGAADPGGILISEQTARFVRPLFDLEDAGELDLKGKSEPVRGYRVRGPSSQPGPTRGVAGLHSPMVGREAELTALVELARTTRAGRGRVAVVIAEPGLGKSRLLEEARAAIVREESAVSAGATGASGSGQARETAWVTARATSFGERLPFHVIISLLLDVLGMTSVSAPADVDAALRHLIEELGLDPADVHRYLAFLMGLPLEPLQESEVARITADLLAERTGAAVLQLLKGIAVQGPLVIAIEDVHWADQASAGLTTALLTLADEVPVLVICATRDEPASAGWGVITAARARVGRALTEIRLAPLDKSRSSDLVANLLEIESLSPATRELILQKAEGNPYFVEEIIRMLIDRGVIEQHGDRWLATGAAGEVQIPDTLQGLILSRIDRLPEHARRILRVAACIDRQFAVPLLEDVIDQRQDDEQVTGPGMDCAGLGDALGRLEAANLLELAATLPELEYRFSHALVQDAAYASVLRQERRDWHLRIAGALLARYPDREVELSDRLAHHFELGGDALRAVGYLLATADRATLRGALLDARTLYEHAHELLAPDIDEMRGPDGIDPDDLARLRVRVAIGRVATGASFMRADDAVDILTDARAIVDGLGDDRLLAETLRWEVFFRQLRGARPGSSQELDAAMARVADLGGPADDRYMSLTLFETGRMLWVRGDYAAALVSLEGASEAMRRRGDDIGRSMAESYKGAALASLGDFAAATRHMGLAQELAEGADRLAMIDYRLAEAGVAATRGDFETTEREARECWVSSSELGALSCATISGIVLGGAQVAAGHGRDARQTLERSVELARQGFMAPMLPRASVYLATALAQLGEADSTEAGYLAAIDALTASGNRYGLAEAQIHLGRMLASRDDGDLEAALGWLDSARSIFEELGARPDLARADRARGMVLGRLGRTEEADAAFGAAIALAGEMDLRDGPWPATFAEAPNDLLEPAGAG